VLTVSTPLSKLLYTHFVCGLPDLSALKLRILWIKKFVVTPHSGFNMWNHKLYIKVFLKWSVAYAASADHPPSRAANSHIYTARFDGSDMKHYFELYAATWS